MEDLLEHIEEGAKSPLQEVEEAKAQEDKVAVEVHVADEMKAAEVLEETEQAGGAEEEAKAGDATTAEVSSLSKPEHEPTSSAPKSKIVEADQGIDSTRERRVDDQPESKNQPADGNDPPPSKCAAALGHAMILARREVTLEGVRVIEEAIETAGSSSASYRSSKR